jgi:S-formylglutathione hydrolase FrmB
MKRLLFFLFFIIRFVQAQDKGTVQIDTLVSSALANTLTKEDNRRPLAIYLPPGYFTSPKRYPVLYLLHGIGDDHTDFVDDTSKFYTIQYLMDYGIASHRFGEMIIVTPNEKTNWFGSFYTNSTATGNWEDFTATELVNYMDTKYRTIAKPESRAIAGHSMGGYGAIRIAMKHPDIFSVVYSMNGAFICFAGENSMDSPDIKKFVLSKTYEELLATQRKNAMGMLTVAQAFSPNPANPPFYADKPFKMEGDKVVPNPAAYDKWLENDVVNMAKKYKSNLLKLRGIMFDAGDQDEWKFIVINNRLFSKKLSSLHIHHKFEEYQGDHRNKIWGLNGRIFNDMLPFVFDKMEK